MSSTTQAQFHAHIREQERLFNAGCLSRYDSARNVTRWFVADRVVGVSAGPVGASTQYRIQAS